MIGPDGTRTDRHFRQVLSRPTAGPRRRRSPEQHPTLSINAQRRESTKKQPLPAAALRKAPPFQRPPTRKKGSAPSITSHGPKKTRVMSNNSLAWGSSCHASRVSPGQPAHNFPPPHTDVFGREDQSQSVRLTLPNPAPDFQQLFYTSGKNRRPSPTFMARSSSPASIPRTAPASACTARPSAAGQTRARRSRKRATPPALRLA